MTAILEAKYLKNLALEELIVSLMTYKMSCMIHGEHNEHKNYLPKNMKDLTLRT